MDLAERVDRALPSGRLAVACSGGADSIALLYLAVEAGRDVVAFHVDHGLRSDSHVDAQFVAATCEGLGVRCDVLEVHVPSRPSMEAAAREVRYGALAARSRELGIDAVATAHTLDDQAETVLLRLTRGGSLAGIAARRNMFVRPLLDVRRHELRTYLRERGIAWRDDPTNDDLRIERNWTRNVLLPQLAERRSGVALVLARHATRAAEDDAALAWMARTIFAGADIDDAGVRLAGIGLIPRAVARRVVRLSMRTLHLEATEDDIDSVTSGERLRTRGVHAWLDDDLVVVRDPLPAPSCVHLGGGVLDAPEWGVRLRVGDGRDASWRWRSSVPAGALAIRPRTDGDRVRTSGGTKKVHDVLIDAKIPRALRELVPVVTCDDRAVAVVALTCDPSPSPLVLDAEPLDATWSRKVVWNGR